MNTEKKYTVDIVVDMQNDFITGSLGTGEAQKILPCVADTIRQAAKDGHLIFATQDTHEAAYLESREGKMLPVKHCIAHTAGWAFPQEIENALLTKGESIPGAAPWQGTVQKDTFGARHLPETICTALQKNGLTVQGIEKFRIYGLCTDICVISNFMILRAFFPETEIEVLRDCCAGVTPESHENALRAMAACQATIL